MARIVAGFASSHTPPVSLPGQDWAKRAEDDKRNRELIRPTDGARVTYDELLASADPRIAGQIAAMGATPMDLLTYQPGYRSPAGTGCGCALGSWLP